jgi:type III secretion protein C
MKNLFTKRLFFKLGFLVSVYAVQPANSKIYAYSTLDDAVRQKTPAHLPPVLFSVDAPVIYQEDLVKVNAVSDAVIEKQRFIRSNNPNYYAQEESFRPQASQAPAQSYSTASPSYYPVSLPNIKTPQPDKLASPPAEQHEDYGTDVRSQPYEPLQPLIKNLKPQVQTISSASEWDIEFPETTNEQMQQPAVEKKIIGRAIGKDSRDSEAMLFGKSIGNQAAPSLVPESAKPSRNSLELLTQSDNASAANTPPGTSPAPNPPKTILINFNNVSIIEFIRFISRVSNRNFVFDEGDLQFNVTIVSEEATSIENIMTALLQELRIHDLTLIEQGNNLIIHKNPKVNALSKVVADDLPETSPGTSEIITQVFRLNTLEPDRAAAIIRPLISDSAILEFIKDSNHLIVTDLHTNVAEIGKLLKSLDAPTSGLIIGQYVASAVDIDQLISLVQQIMSPISKNNPLVLVPYEATNSIFIVSTPFLVERSIAILQHMDQETGKTQIINLHEMGPGKKGPSGAGQHGQGGGTGAEAVPPAQWEDYIRSLQDLFPPGGGPGEEGKQEANTLPLFIPVEIPQMSTEDQERLKEASQAIDALKALQAKPTPPPPWQVGMPSVIEPEPITPMKIQRPLPLNEEYVPVPINRIQFYIHKLQYRSGDLILGQVQQIAASLQNTQGNEDLIAIISTIQWLQDSKSLVITGIPEYLEKVRALVEQLDIPLRQVFIEMLILDTSIDDSLNYTVNWGNRFGGGNQAGSQGFSSGTQQIVQGPAGGFGVLDTAGVTNLGGSVPITFIPPYNEQLIPDPTQLAKNSGFNLGVIGEHIVHKGLGIEFNSISALVSALHSRALVDIILNPKVITEDNVPAQIFVGVTTPFKTQAVSNDQGSIITNNFEFRDVGTSLQVTPHLHNSDMITLEIVQDRSTLTTTAATSANANTVIGPTTDKSSTKTTVHLPNGYFVILSGMIQDTISRTRTQVPCLGSAPLIGGAFSDKENADSKRNQMTFIYARIIDTDEELQNITRHQQDIWEFTYTMPKFLNQETEEALDFFNVPRTSASDDEDVPPGNRHKKSITQNSNTN